MVKPLPNGVYMDGPKLCTRVCIYVVWPGITDIICTRTRTHVLHLVCLQAKYKASMHTLQSLLISKNTNLATCCSVVHVHTYSSMCVDMNA